MPRADKGTRWLVYALSVGVGLLPAIAHWFGDFLASRPYHFESILTLPEGYIFSFLVSSSTFMDAQFKYEDASVAWRNWVRVIMIFLSFVVAATSLVCYTAMVKPDYPSLLIPLQISFVITSLALNLAYVTMNIVLGD